MESMQLAFASLLIWVHKETRRLSFWFKLSPQFLKETHGSSLFWICWWLQACSCPANHITLKQAAHLKCRNAESKKGFATLLSVRFNSIIHPLVTLPCNGSDWRWPWTLEITLFWFIISLKEKLTFRQFIVYRTISQSNNLLWAMRLFTSWLKNEDVSMKINIKV